MKLSILCLLSLSSLSWSGFIDCEYYTNAECGSDSSCLIDSNGECRADCTKILFPPVRCDSVIGCTFPSTINEGEALECIFTNYTKSPTGAPITASPTQTVQTISPTPANSGTTTAPTGNNGTPSPSPSPTTANGDTTTVPTPSNGTPSPTFSNVTPSPSTSNQGNGRCSADGSVQEQRFPPSGSIILYFFDIFLDIPWTNKYI